MALIENRSGRLDGGYTRLLGDEHLGRLLSRVQSAVIAAGTELERFVTEQSRTIDNLDEYLDLDVFPEGIFVAPKRIMKRSSRINYAGVEPDFVAFEKRGKNQRCYMIELKDGDTFDTKKAAGERESMYKFMNAIAPHIPFQTSVHFCCFNRESRDQVVEGFKNKITAEEALTGPELCRLLEIDYEALILRRQQHQKRNFAYFIDAMLGVPSVVEALEDRAGTV